MQPLLHQIDVFAPSGFVSPSGMALGAVCGGIRHQPDHHYDNTNHDNSAQHIDHDSSLAEAPQDRADNPCQQNDQDPDHPGLVRQCHQVVAEVAQLALSCGRRLPHVSLWNGRSIR